LLEQKDIILKSRLEAFVKKDGDYWSFRGKAVREHAHAYFQYPAMMVPQMQSELIGIIKDISPGIKRILDPFVGSGTTMTEAMLQNLDFTGQDINPLSYLLCRVKSGPFFLPSIVKKAQKVVGKINRLRSKKIEVEFAGMNKWFQHNIAIELSHIKRAILEEDSKWARRFFWITLAETVRLTSNCRTSTYKLHIRPRQEVESRGISAKDIFNKILFRNIDRLSKIHDMLDERKLLNRGHYKGEINICIGDTSNTIKNAHTSDLLITSPPYGDNNTTVPYGQHSYLPLQWIPPCDIISNLDGTYLNTTHEIDRRSLGGSRKNAVSKSQYLNDKSYTFQKMMNLLENKPSDCQSRLAAFCVDLDASLELIINALKPDSYMIWILGNRRIANKTILVDEIVSDLLVHKGCIRITKLQRRIPNKRSASKNKTTSTMNSESILVLRKTV